MGTQGRRSFGRESIGRMKAARASAPQLASKESYWGLDENVLGDVLLLCEQWEAESIRTEKRISD